MKGLREKFQKNGGFTLVEMLIVVAIIAILVAVSVPLVGNALEKARLATDDANLRAGKSEALIMYMNDQVEGTTSISDDYYYNIEKGTFETGRPTTGYNKSGLRTTPATKANTMCIVVTIKDNDPEPVSVAWKEVTVAP